MITRENEPDSKIRRNGKRSENLRVRSSNGGGIALVDAVSPPRLRSALFLRLDSGKQSRENIRQLFITSVSFRFVIEFPGVDSLSDKIPFPFERPGRNSFRKYCTIRSPRSIKKLTDNTSGHLDGSDFTYYLTIGNIVCKRTINANK